MPTAGTAGMAIVMARFPPVRFEQLIHLRLHLFPAAAGERRQFRPPHETAAPPRAQPVQQLLPVRQFRQLRHPVQRIGRLAFAVAHARPLIDEGE